MTLDWIDLIALFTFIQLLFLTVVILNYKKGKRLSNRLLAGFMASNALLIAHALLTHLGWTSSEKWTGIYSIERFYVLPPDALLVSLHPISLL